MDQMANPIVDGNATDRHVVQGCPRSVIVKIGKWFVDVVKGDLTQTLVLGADVHVIHNQSIRSIASTTSNRLFPKKSPR